jgi:cytochrome P450
MNPIEAATSQDPYPFYAELVSTKPFYFDEQLQMWIASSASAVSAVLSHEHCKVRPHSETIPKGLLGSDAGEIFGALMRMSDGSMHCPLKKSILQAASPDVVTECRQLSIRMATSFLQGVSPASFVSVVRRMMFELPVYVVSAMLGIPESDWLSLVPEVSAFVSGITPTATAEQTVVGNCAARVLSQRLEEATSRKQYAGMLLDAFTKLCTEKGIGRNSIAANAVGFLFQTYEATAALIGNSIRILANNPHLVSELGRNRTLLRRFIQEVLRFDPPVQNTLRYVFEDANLEGKHSPNGAQILILLAAANRDPAHFTNPNEFDLLRSDAFSFAFGLDRHECPGQSFVYEIAAASLETLLLSRSFPWEQFARPLRYRPSVNTRVPLY